MSRAMMSFSKCTVRGCGLMFTFFRFALVSFIASRRELAWPQLRLNGAEVNVAMSRKSDLMTQSKVVTSAPIKAASTFAWSLCSSHQAARVFAGGTSWSVSMSVALIGVVLAVVLREGDPAPLLERARKLTATNSASSSAALPNSPIPTDQRMCRCH